MKLMIPVVGHALNALATVAPRPAGRLTFGIFARPWHRGGVHPTELDVHARAEVETFRVDDADVVTYRWGDGTDPVLLLHGWSSRGSRFAGFVRELERLGYTAVAVDAPGHGDSTGRSTTVMQYSRVVQRLHERYGPFRAVVGHSFGVPTAFHAVRSGVRADRVVAISAMYEFEHLVDEFARRLRLRRRLRSDLRQRFEKHLAPERSVWERFSLNYDATAISVPMLVVHDEGDEYVPVDHARRTLAAYEQTAQLSVTRGLGHGRILRDPAVVSTVMDFLMGRTATNPTPPAPPEPYPA